MKKEKSPVLVILCIFFLLSFIVLPPTFRKLIPKKVPVVEKKNTKNITILMCNKTDYHNKYNASIKMRYVNNKPISNIITYSPIKDDNQENVTNQEQENQNNSTNETIDQTDNNNNELDNNSSVNNDNILTTVAEYDLLKSIPNIDLVSENGINTFKINSTLKKNNPELELLDKYFNDDINIEKDYCESIGYTCNLIKN